MYSSPYRSGLFSAFLCFSGEKLGLNFAEKGQLFYDKMAVRQHFLCFRLASFNAGFTGTVCYISDNQWSAVCLTIMGKRKPSLIKASSSLIAQL